MNGDDIIKNDVEESMDFDDNEEDIDQEVFNPKKHTLAEGEELEMEEEAYTLYHSLKVEHSCLSFDIIQDNLGSGELRSETFPYTVYAISGSQAPQGHSNILTVMKMSNLDKLKKNTDNNDDESEEDSEDESLDEKADMTYVNIPHNGGVNRVRSQNINGNTVASSWSEIGQVYIWDLKNQLWAINDSAYKAEYMSRNETVQPLYAVKNHSTEGFAMDWSSFKPGQLATGDNNGQIFITQAKEHGFETIMKPLAFHKSSVEDIQWSPNQENILISCSSDRSINVWDMRDMKHHVSMTEAHSSDINVISWSRTSAFLLLSGGDDGIVKLWDMRMFGRSTGGQSTANTQLYDYHKGCPITSIEWCPQSQDMFACSSEDDMVTFWDISIEQEEMNQDDGYPFNMLFNHMGQKEIKEIHWHPQIPGLILSTAVDGINVFKPSNL